MNGKHLIVTADDFGLHVAINHAVEQASAAGILTAASLMMGEAATGDAVDRARQMPKLRVGLHIVLADGWPVLDPRLIPALVDPDGRMDSRMLIKALRFCAQPARAQLEAEIRAQFTAFARTGLTLDHVNVHKHFHLHPVVLSTLVRVGNEFGLRAVRVPSEPGWFAARASSWQARVERAVLSPWISSMQRRLRQADIFQNDQLFGIAASGRMEELALLAIIGRLPAGVTEIYLHPAATAGKIVAESMREYRHADELAALLSPRVRAAVETSGASLGGYADAARERRKAVA